MSDCGVGALYLPVCICYNEFSLSDIILLKQVVVLWIAHKVIITSLEANECSGGLLPFWLVIFITYSIMCIIMSYH
jgi:hypothetical protein